MIILKKIFHYIDYYYFYIRMARLDARRLKVEKEIKKINETHRKMMEYVNKRLD